MKERTKERKKKEEKKKKNIKKKERKRKKERQIEQENRVNHRSTDGPRTQLQRPTSLYDDSHQLCEDIRDTDTAPPDIHSQKRMPPVA